VSRAEGTAAIDVLSGETEQGVDVAVAGALGTAGEIRASDPTPGSVSASASTVSPAIAGGSHRRFTSSVASRPRTSPASAESWMPYV